MILASHLGRPDGKVSDSLRLRPVGARLGQLLGKTVPVTGDALGVGTLDAINRLRPGEVLLLENLRFHAEEEKNDPAFAEALAAYADVYVNDAFGTAHRAHASTVGIAKLRPAYAGFLMEKEIANLGMLLDKPGHPFAAIIGGAKVSDKIKVLKNLLDKVDIMVIGGGMANTFLLAQGKPVGKSLAEPDRVEDAREIIAAAEEKGVNLVLPGRRRDRQGGHARLRVQDDPGREGPRELAHRRPRQAEPRQHRGGARRRPDGALERAAGRVRDPVVRARHQGDGPVPRGPRRGAARRS